MITIFNRRELTITFEMGQQDRIRSILSRNGIPYTYRTHGRATAGWGGSHRSRAGSLGENLDFLIHYQFFVHKKDFDRAIYLINQPIR